ncbi:zinc finger BED domain-containing protein 4-like [Archocentrus centrarchus]|uniref:zinc finger BED domain-containing protein 4-like n=1 Tax=Archocentrus centrarchus TaxID=63155 RepID=UPI0011EA4C16|nr:zinc finger BED domain-containing protein 4-like [Archocentrus centrarchus]XP_030581324.1 zinc finger BED domain-containing protein 4-like [Archocentrus centrarchus]XP_030581823.1 zinc finger BED domain-containing protein 4-like [Archocentrus centrarchus]XP_030584212.1 zinc finger BED domain-containing protein 4-like [Archocentrus centrarchus]XP_030599469.1 zinc finger BED domain-containing protein 4-like [Archocentrus centrarchus]XP_030601967.1 zinc finger BED domain-containing protein 4-l
MSQQYLRYCGNSAEARRIQAMMSTNSFVWGHFTKIDNDSAKCMLCDRVVKCSGGSTSGLRRHLESKHDKHEERPSCSKRAKMLDGYFSRVSSKSLEEILAEMAAFDGFSFNSMAKCEYLRSALKRDGYTLPKNPTEISKQVRVFANEEKIKLAEMFQDMVKKGLRFSLTIDEYTSSQHKRYMSINVHGAQTYWNLGVIHVRGTMPAEKVKALVDDQLQCFKLDMNQHIVCCTTDGASVMVKFGRLVLPELQLCYAHAVHLAVTDVLYHRATSDGESKASEEEEESSEDSDDELAVCEDGYRSVREDMYRSVERVRKIARHFHKSPVSNDKLRECVKQDQGKELALILDCRTRWNSLADMLDRYIALHRPVTKTLVDINNALIITNEELALIQQLSSCLKPVKMGVESLCNRDTTLVKADGIFIFMIDQLTKQDTPLSLEMRDAIERRFMERRQKNLVSLYRYLLDPGVLVAPAPRPTEIFTMPSRQMLIRTAKGLVERLFLGRFSEESASEGDADARPTSPTEDVSTEGNLALDLQQAISMTTTPASDEIKEGDLMKVLTKEFSLFEATNRRPPHLQQLFDALHSVQATSVEAERAFSICGQFVTKLRNRLSAESLDALCFLKAHFQKKKKASEC